MSGGGGYDISQSTSEATTQGLHNQFGDFVVGGGLRFPKWGWYVVAALAAYWVWKKL